MSDKEFAIYWAKLWIDSEFSSQRTRTIARYILSTANAEVQPQSTVTMTMADYEALKAWADGRVAKAWSGVNELTASCVNALRYIRANHKVDFWCEVSIDRLIDQWDRRRERLTEDAK